jgi:REP element-mobilizing transposase RayT
MWEIIGSECLNLNLVYGVQFHSLVLMPNHFHMLVTTPQHDLGASMQVFLSYVTRTSNLISGRSGHLFGGRYHWTLINNTRYFGNVYKYVYRNPVRANLCVTVENYPYSTLHGQVGLSPLPFPLYETRVGMEINLASLEVHEQLKWLNSPFPKEEEELIRRGLRKRILDRIVDKRTRKPVSNLEQLL